MLKDFQNFVAFIQYTPNDECGMSENEFYTDILYIELNYFIVNEYIDPKNFENPIQKTFKDIHYSYLKMFVHNLIDLDIRK